MVDKIKTPKEIGEMLRSKGVKPSVIRIQVMKYLLEHRAHPNVDTIYKFLIKEMPTLSKTSIYNTLKTFSSKGLVLEVMTGSGEILFDGYPERHAHFTCTECKKIVDVSLDCEICKTHGLEGYTITEQSVYLKGICTECGKVKSTKKVISKK
ncbi:MAG: Fur family transcriptional regulator [bacterium]